MAMVFAIDYQSFCGSCSTNDKLDVFSRYAASASRGRPPFCEARVAHGILRTSPARRPSSPNSCRSSSVLGENPAIVVERAFSS